MSRPAQDWAVTQSPQTPLEKLALMVLADHHNLGTGRCDPSTARLVATCCCSKRGIINALDALEKQGFITITKRVGRRSRYLLHMEQAVHSLHQLNNQSGALSAPVDETQSGALSSQSGALSSKSGALSAPEPGRTGNNQSPLHEGVDSWNFCPKWFDPDPDWIETIEIAPGVDWRHELQRFKNHEFAQPKTDPYRAFKNWLLRAMPSRSDKRPNFPNKSDYLAEMLDDEPQAIGDAS